MPKHEIDIEISGLPATGKTRVIQIINAALKKEGYSSITLKPFGNHEDRLMVFDDFHSLNIYTTQTKAEQATDSESTT